MLSLAGVAAGAVHGYAVFFILIPLLAEHHPIEEVRGIGVGLSALYFLGHIFYGLTVGCSLLAFG